MNVLKVHLLEPTPTNVLRALSRGLGRFIFAASVLFILFAGTFPFDFSPTFDRSTPFDWHLKQYDPYFSDRGQNILFFFPFGFGLAAIIRPSMKRTRWRLGLSPIASFLLSGIVEVLQKFVSFRDPSVMDLWSNVVGGVLGAAAYVMFGDLLLAAAARGLLRLRPYARTSILAGIAGSYGMLYLLAPLLLRDPGDLSVWDPDLPLVVGNEVSGDRPWRGTIGEIALADRAATEDQALRLSEGDAPEQVLGNSLLGHYRLAQAGPFPDLTNQLPPLQWVPGPATNFSNRPPVIDAEHWLSTLQSVEPANRRIMKSSQLTFAATITTPSLEQRGPARLASISGGTLWRNLQLGQEFAYLVVRVRTAARSTPDLYVRDVFTPDVPRHVIVTTKSAETIVYVDGRERGRIYVTPEAKIIWRLYPRAFRIRLEKYGFRSYAAIYRAIVFIPLATLIGAALMLASLKPPAKWLLAASSLLLMAALLEVVLHHLGGTFEPINLFISLLIGCCTLGGLLLWRNVRDPLE